MSPAQQESVKAAAVAKMQAPPEPAQPPAPQPQQSPLDRVANAQRLMMGFEGNYVSPEEKAQLASDRKRYSELVNSQIQKQADSIKQMKLQAQEMREKRPGLNLAPLMGYIDFLNKGKSNTLGAYMNSGLMPESPEQRQAKISQLQKAISQAEDKLTDKEIKVLKANLDAQKAGTSFSTNMRAMTRLLSQEGVQKRHNAKEAAARQKEFMKWSTDLNEKVTADSRQFNQLSDAFEQGDYQSVMANLGVFARVISGERGVLTDKDITRVIPRSILQDEAQLKAYFTEDGAATAKVDPNWTRALKKLISIARKNKTKEYKDQIDLHQQQTNTLPMYEAVRPYFKKSYKDLITAVTKGFTSELEAKDLDKSGEGGIPSFEAFQKQRSK